MGKTNRQGTHQARTITLQIMGITVLMEVQLMEIPTMMSPKLSWDLIELLSTILRNCHHQ